MARPSNRERILDAFEDILIEFGPTQATLDAVAERAQVSKGGLMYHFPSKEMLVAAFGERVLRHIDHSLADVCTDPLDVIRRFVIYDSAGSEEERIVRSLIAAIHGADVGLSDIVRLAFDRWASPLAVLPPPLAVVLRMISDGMMLNEVLGNARPSMTTLEEIVNHLAAWLDEIDAAE